MIQVRASWQLNRCPECGQTLPKDWDWDVRSLVWLHDLPRKISPTNNDLTIHDGGNGRNRFLHLEFKPDNRALSVGQDRHLLGLSKSDQHGVLLVRGKRVDRVTIQQATRGSWGSPIDTTCESLNTAIASWLSGGLWRDAAAGLTAKAVRRNVPAGRPGHTHGFALVDGRRVCVQDFYAVGFDPSSGCGEEWAHVVDAAA